MEYYLNTPLDEKTVRSLKIGDIVYLTGVIVTMRDKAHSRVLEFQKEDRTLPFTIYNSVIYHCGPVVKKIGDKWEIISCGPTTSYRMEEYESVLITEYNIRMIIGKGGMGDKTVEALNKIGAVYASFTGGAGVLAAQKIIEVQNAYWLELGVPEAVWFLKVKDFGPLIITIDSHKRNMYREVNVKALRKLAELT